MSTKTTIIIAVAVGLISALVIYGDAVTPQLTKDARSLMRTMDTAHEAVCTEPWRHRELAKQICK